MVVRKIEDLKTAIVCQTQRAISSRGVIGNSITMLLPGLGPGFVVYTNFAKTIGNKGIFSGSIGTAAPVEKDGWKIIVNY